MLKYNDEIKNNKNLVEINRFLEKHHFNDCDFDIDKEVTRFVHEMELGLKGDGILPMIPTYVGGNLHAIEGKKVITIDIGGSNLRLALVEIIDGNTVVSNVFKSELPGIYEEISFTRFMDVLVNKIVPYLEYSNIISLSFAHQVKHNSELDGYAVEISKELHIEGIEGKLLADSLKCRLVEWGYKDIQIVLINDTVGIACSLIQKAKDFSSFIGVVMGTGVNSAYLERCENISKIDDAKTYEMFINIESGNFIPRNLSDFDKEYIKTTQNSNTAVMEKMISGRYLGELFHFIIKKGCESELFSPEFIKNIDKHENIDTEEMSRFYSDKSADGIYSRACSSQNDFEALYYICEKLIVRAAHLIAVNIIAISKKAARKDNKPICCIVEGTTYYKIKGLGKMVNSIINKNSKELEIETYNIDNAALKGIGNIGISIV